MDAAHLLVITPVAALVLVPLAREYADFRREWGFGRFAAVATTLLVLPAFCVGLALALPLADEPALQWAVTVGVTVALYSVGTSAVGAAAAPARARD